MADYDVDFDINLEEDNDVANTQEQEATSSVNDDIGYETIEDGDSKYVKIPVDEFEALKQGAMRMEDYTAKTQTVSALTERLRKTIESLEGDVKDSEGNDVDVSSTTPELDVEEMQKRIDELIEEKVSPIYEAEARRALEEETKQFKEKYGFLFNGDSNHDNEILSRIYLTAATYTHNDGSPLSLEEAFAIAFKDDLLNTTTELVKRESERRKLWGSEADTNMGSNEPTISSEEDADKVFMERVRALRGY